MFARDFKQWARDSLQGHWGLAVGTGLVAMLLIGDVSIGSGFTYRGYDQSLVSLPWLLWTMSIGGIWLLVGILIGGATEIGYARFNLSLIDRQEASFQQIFSEYHRLSRGIAQAFLRFFFTFLWSLLLVIPGVVAALSYSMMPYIMAEYPEVTASQAMDISKEMMRGNKTRLFCLELSFFGWMLLGAVTFGLSYLAVWPYMQAAEAAFYRSLVKEGHMPLGERPWNAGGQF